MSSSSHNIELEAAKFLHKLIQDSEDEPSKLATKLYVILQHMKTSGKEYSMPYQVISRAMETVGNQHGLDIHPHVFLMLVAVVPNGRFWICTYGWVFSSCWC